MQNQGVAKALFLNGPEHPMMPSEATLAVHLSAALHSLLPLSSYISLLAATKFLCFFKRRRRLTNNASQDGYQQGGLGEL